MNEHSLGSHFKAAVTDGGARPRVLCVDDETAILNALSRSLRRDFEVRTAQSAADALDLMQSEGPFSVLIADQRMPGMTGVELLAVARDRFRDTTRIVLTGYADAACERAARSEADAFLLLNKPWMADELVCAVRAAVARHEERKAEAAPAHQPEPSAAIASL